MQLWVDLPTELKACEPRYRDLRAAEIPIVEADSGRVTVKVISGQSHGTDSVQELAYTPVWLLDVTIRPGGKIAQGLPAGWNAFAYLLEGSATFGAGKDAMSVPNFHNVVFEQDGDEVIVEVPESAKEAVRFSEFFSHTNASALQLLTIFFFSSRRRPAARPGDRSARTVRPQQQGRRVPGSDGLSHAPERLRTG